ncbi:helix-turn-helix transcriptional regulator [Oceanicola sp. 22II-s10i]|uniref:ArsR/SmtB family transcription factor n=1 Tax=Oceanicola sp. 22II-s10i TaxID=1317116 RepID=UPI000B527218|nr:metalloregulator ArsR/SmtB family transcription factor [Oceanicola sp. 22II-s10i]
MDQSPALAALSALAHETRLEIVRLLVRAGCRGRAAGDIAEAVGASASGLSFHLRHLEQAGLIRARREGRQVIYALDRPRMGALIGYLLSDCCADDAEVRACCLAVRTDPQEDFQLDEASGTAKI